MYIAHKARPILLVFFVIVEMLELWTNSRKKGWEGVGNKNPTDTGTGVETGPIYIIKEVISACPTTIYLESLEPFWLSQYTVVVLNI